MKKTIALCCLFATCTSIFAQTSISKKDFKSPNFSFKPAPFWHMNGTMTNQGLDSQMRDIKYKSNFGGVTILPVSAQKGFTGDVVYPGTAPAYLTEGYFDSYTRILDNANNLGLKVVWYDDLDFPSGSAGGRMKKLYPEDTRKILTKTDSIVNGPLLLEMTVPNGKIMAAVAMNTVTKSRVDISKNIINQSFRWEAPAGKWKIMFFTCDVVSNSDMPNDVAVDYLDPIAVKKYIVLNNEAFAKRYQKYFGKTITQIFFDDVGFFTLDKHGERTWTKGFNEKFMSLYHKDPSLLYPALWEDIGPETDAARVALFNTRAELLSEGFPKLVKEWCHQYGLKSSGHPPGNYEIQPVDMNGDIVKYYRHQDIPLMDLIFSHTHGRDGFKLISSSANMYDKPIVAAEIYGAIGWFNAEKFTQKTLYKAGMDVFVRGVNFLIPHGMWYNPAKAAVRIPPLISEYNPEIGPYLKDYNEWAGRVSYMLQGGKTVSEIAILYPIASLQSYFKFDANKTKSIGDWGKYASPTTDYLKLSDIFTMNVHRDFTFLHPEVLSSDQVTIADKIMTLHNELNEQQYKIVIMPGESTISLKSLEKIKTFYDQGGAVIATSELPMHAAEFGQDEEVIKIVQSIFSKPGININKNGGKAIYINNPTVSILSETLLALKISADVQFENNPQPNAGEGALSYIHKIKDGKNIYFIANSAEESVHTFVELKGQLHLEQWNPNTGMTEALTNAQYIQKEGIVYTRLPLNLNPIQSTFLIESNK